MRYLLSITGIVLSFYMLRYREQFGDMIGGRYMLGVGIALFIFLWSVAALVGADDFLFRPVLWIFPGSQTVAEPAF